jgi:1,5-anhydro-D-fructose reductase (1,5-anhydro-D-mannitol-forming)
MKWGLVGASTIAAQHMIAAIRAQGPGQVKWLVSGAEKRGSSYAAEHDIAQSTTEIDRMLADPEVDAVYISSTNEKHHDQALRAINAGKHVLCEKPLAMSLGQAVEMVQAAADRGVVLATNHHLRNAGAHLAIRDLITSGEIGDVQSMRVFHAVSLPQNLQGWRINNMSAGGGVILDIIVHDADTVRFHLGEDPAEVVAIAGSSGMGQGVEDSVMTAWTMPSGVMVQVHASFTHRFAETGLEIYGSKGAIRGGGVMTQKPVGPLELVTAEGRRPVPFSPHSLYERAVALFVAATIENTPPAADGVDGVKSLAVALAVREAAVQGQQIIVDYGGF